MQVSKQPISLFLPPILAVLKIIYAQTSPFHVKNIFYFEKYMLQYRKVCDIMYNDILLFIFTKNRKEILCIRIIYMTACRDLMFIK